MMLQPPPDAVICPFLPSFHQITHTTTHSFHTYYPNYCAHNKRLNCLFLVFIAVGAASAEGPRSWRDSSAQSVWPISEWSVLSLVSAFHCINISTIIIHCRIYYSAQCSGKGNSTKMNASVCGVLV